ncbi:MAG: argininosuccinate synthase [Desulfurococcales archaeon]|nr:argininosuccinate synthase [Desulfurococcales archaeon]
MRQGRVVLAYSGGLDTSAMILLLRERGMEVVTVTVDVGQSGDLQEVEDRAYKLGSSDHYTVDAKREFALGYVAKAVKANALYEDAYPLGTALARPLIALKVAEVARKVGAEYVAHGCTGKGNDQVRFDSTLRLALGDGVKILALVRELGLRREHSISILSSKGFKPPGLHGKYSIDDNLWTRSIEGDFDGEPPEEVFEWTVNPERAPDKPARLSIEFHRGLPVAVNGARMELHDLIVYLNRILGSHGYGRIDHIENRVVGFKSREVYEAPAALALLAAHRDLEKAVYTPLEYRFKRLLDASWTDLVYNGLWIDPLRLHLEAAIDSMNDHVTGTVTLKVYKGSLSVVSRSSPYSTYSKDLEDYNRGWYPSARESEGFVKLYTMHSLLAARARGLG